METLAKILVVIAFGVVMAIVLICERNAANNEREQKRKEPLLP